MFTISKEFGFSASHQLSGLPEDHPCSRLHGHNYVIRVVLQSEALDEVGFVTDYRALEPVKAWIDLYVDHRHLNDVIDDNPTAEAIAVTIFNRFEELFPEMVEVGVSETPKTWATFRL